MNTVPSPSNASDAAGVLIYCVAGVAIVSLNNPAKMNALTPESADRLVQALDEIDVDASIGALIIKGENGTFCAGADLGALSELSVDPASDASYGALDRIYRAFTRFGEMRVPTIAAVRGSAIGAGLNLALAADVRIVANNARIISGFERIHVHPGGGHFQLLAQASSREAATALAIFSEEIDGLRAVQLGLAWESLDDLLVEERALALAARAAQDPDLARKSIQSLHITTPQPIPWMTALQAERAPQLWSFRRSAMRQADK